VGKKCVRGRLGLLDRLRCDDRGPKTDELRESYWRSTWGLGECVGATALDMQADESLAAHHYIRDSATGLCYRKRKSTLKVRCFSSEGKKPEPL
jgi:hypothetical protein